MLNLPRRINRFTYIIASSILGLVSIPIVWLATEDTSPYADDEGFIGWGLLVLVFVLFFISIILAKRRANDATENHPVLLTLVSFILPLGGLILWIMRSEKGETRFGPMPPRGFRIQNKPGQATDTAEDAATTEPDKTDQ